METTNAIPFTAWEQAVFVALFIVMVVLLLTWFSKQQKSWQEFMRSQNESWQNSIREQNESWQKWLNEENQRECDAMEKVTKSLEKLSDKLTLHDEKVETRFIEAVSKLEKTSKSKGVKNVQ